MLDAVVECPDQARVDRPLVDLDDRFVDVWAQLLEMVVLAAVVVQEEVLGTDEAVELEPLEHVARMVPVHRADRQIGRPGHPASTVLASLSAARTALV